MNKEKLIKEMKKRIHKDTFLEDIKDLIKHLNKSELSELKEYFRFMK